jgi:hypothetical protein
MTSRHAADFPRRHANRFSQGRDLGVPYGPHLKEHLILLDASQHAGRARSQAQGQVLGAEALAGKGHSAARQGAHGQGSAAGEAFGRDDFGGKP